jgi:NAD-reducing hydrogenase small subunit
MSLLDIDERILDLIQVVELTSSPITDLKHPPEDGVDVGILTGSVGNTDQEAIARQMRDRCKVLISMGDCAVFGGINTMRNYLPTEEVLRCGYVETASTVDGKVPTSGELAVLLDRVKSVSEVVEVDISIPGCPPPADAIWYVLTELVAGRIPKLTDENLRYD